MKDIILKRIIITLFAIFLCISIVANSYMVNAVTGFDKTTLESFDADSAEKLNIGDVANTMDSVIETVITIVKTVSVAIAIVMLLVIGMRYMVASPGDRADIKKHAIVYVVGAFILFGVSGILTILMAFAENIDGDTIAEE